MGRQAIRWTDTQTRRKTLTGRKKDRQIDIDRQKNRRRDIGRQTYR